MIIEANFGLPTAHASPWKADIVSIGSILDAYGIRRPQGVVKLAMRLHPAHVWGSGLMFDRPVSMPWYMRFHAVRGHLTQNLVGAPAADAALGDPGLLSPTLVPAAPEKKYRYGLVPHKYDRDDPSVQAFAERLGDCHMINVWDHAHDVLRQISECEIVISTSLHGLIVADSYGVPNVWAECGDRVSGAGFKFRDYYSVFGIEPEAPLQLGDAPGPQDVAARTAGYERNGLAQTQKGLIDAFAPIASQFS